MPKELKLKQVVKVGKPYYLSILRNIIFLHPWIDSVHFVRNNFAVPQINLRDRARYLLFARSQQKATRAILRFGRNYGAKPPNISRTINVKSRILTAAWDSLFISRFLCTWTALIRLYRWPYQNTGYAKVQTMAASCVLSTPFQSSKRNLCAIFAIGRLWTFAASRVTAGRCQ